MLPYGPHQLGFLSSKPEESLLLSTLYLMLWQMGFGPEGKERFENLSLLWQSETVFHRNVIFSCFRDNPALSQRSECPIILFLCYQSHDKKKVQIKANDTIFSPLVIKQRGYRQEKGGKNSKAMSFFYFSLFCYGNSYTSILSVLLRQSVFLLKAKHTNVV